jgi:hypothetical protein
MPLESKEDFALGDTESSFCKYCVDEKGQLLSYEAILENNVHYYKESQGITDAAATKMARDLLVTMPAWKQKGV